MPKVLIISVLSTLDECFFLLLKLHDADVMNVIWAAVGVLGVQDDVGDAIFRIDDVIEGLVTTIWKTWGHFYVLYLASMQLPMHTLYAYHVQFIWPYQITIFANRSYPLTKAVTWEADPEEEVPQGIELNSCKSSCFNNRKRIFVNDVTVLN